jgi:hypothetical protein
MKQFAHFPLLFLPAPAFAHVGDHSGFDVASLLAHVFETDHIVFALLAVLMGVLAYRAGRRQEAKLKEAKRKEPPHDPK